VAIGVAILIMKAAYGLTKESSKGLVDETLPSEEEEIVRQAIMTHAPKFVNFHDMRTRKSGAERFVDLHLVVNRQMCVLDGHALCEDLEKEIESRLPHTNVLIHLEPCDDSACPYCDGSRFVKVEEKQGP
jgi:divalent metal cation (Fe/Co/Zn/Cd) transporter